MASPGFEWAYRDLLTAMLIVFMAMAVLALVVTTKPNPHTPIQGNLVFMMHWDKASDSDIDLWVRSPGDKPIGYSRPSGMNCNLIRDDLGKSADPNSENEEMAICRNASAGEYVVNVMAYRVRDKRLPIAVTVESMYSTPTVTSQLFRKSVQLFYEGEELTVIRFTINKNGNLVGDTDSVPTKLFLGTTY